MNLKARNLMVIHPLHRISGVDSIFASIKINNIAHNLCVCKKYCNYILNKEYYAITKVFSIRGNSIFAPKPTIKNGCHFWQPFYLINS